MKVSSVARQRSRARTHHWMLHQVIELDHGLECCFQLALVNAELNLVDVARAVLLQTRSSSPSGSLQDADILTEVPRLDPTPKGSDTVRYLVELKSEVRVKEMALQLLRYQFGAYLSDWTPVRAVLISNDEDYEGQGELYFQDLITDPGDVFWSQCGGQVLQFGVTVLNLCSKRVQNELLESKWPVSLMLYAMGTVKRFDHAVAAELVTRSQSFSEAEIEQCWWPIVKYINERRDLNLSWWVDLERQLTGEDRVMTVMMNNVELTREEGRLIGLEEGIEQGRLEERQEMAWRMLQKGVEKDFIKELCDFDDAQVEALRNGKINGA